MLKALRLRIAVALVSTAMAASAQAQTKIKIGHTSLSDILADFVAIEKGFFKKHGIDAEAQLLRNGSVIVPGLIAGEIQVGTLTPPTLIQAVDSGLPIVAIDGLAILTPDYKGVAVIARNGSNIKEAKDMIGKRFLVGNLNSIMTIMAKEWMRAQGVDPKRATYVEVPMPQIGDVLKTGNADASVLPDPLLSRAVQNDSGYVVGYISKDLPNGTVSMVNAVSKEWADKNPEAVKGFKQAVAEATEWAKSNQEEALNIVAKYLDIKPEIVKASEFPPLDANLSAAQLQWWIDALKKEDLIRTDIKPAQAMLP